ncbi:hypothetical protein ACJMK2_011257 [Sinanodonta woodiana]|uniref:RILP-like protein 1 n=1 Tax=Sinanodonta woodiana TaxID=1069815 RepID=A0ABD3V7K6_SINWO
MDPYSIRRNMSDDILTNVCVTDVYDQAAGIGKDFERLIESYGVESVTDLMPKVIKALEQLEALAAKYEKENSEVSDLKFTIEKLEAEKVEKAQERARFEEELEQIEAAWRRETKELVASVTRLKEENRRLKDSIKEEKQAVINEVIAAKQETEEREIEVLNKLKETVDRQREELRQLRREVGQKTVDTEALQNQLERMVKINAELRRKNNTQRKHARTLMEEKCDLEVALTQKDKQVIQVQELLRHQDSIDGGLQKDKRSLSTDEETELHDIPALPGFQDTGENMANIDEKLSTIGKLVVDLKDPNRPRFTLSELRTVLMERNELKAKLIEVEEELNLYKPPSDGEGDGGRCTLQKDQDDNESSYSGEDLPVQGPINKEPLEKLYPELKRESGIRKFFRFVFGSNQGSPLSPPDKPRSLSKSSL